MNENLIERNARRSGGIDIRARLKIVWGKPREGLSPSSGTSKEKSRSFGSPRFAQ